MGLGSIGKFCESFSASVCRYQQTPTKGWLQFIPRATSWCAVFQLSSMDGRWIEYLSFQYGRSFSNGQDHRDSTPCTWARWSRRGNGNPSSRSTSTTGESIVLVVAPSAAGPSRMFMAKSLPAAPFRGYCSGCWNTKQLYWWISVHSVTMLSVDSCWWSSDAIY